MEKASCIGSSPVDHRGMDDTEKTKNEFYEKGASFFSWNSGRNTPNILLGLTGQIGALEKVLKESSESSTKLANALNSITRTYVWLTGIIALATVAQVFLAFLKK